jgi:hypothetical protein
MKNWYKVCIVPEVIIFRTLYSACVSSSLCNLFASDGLPKAAVQGPGYVPNRHNTHGYFLSMSCRYGHFIHLNISIVVNERPTVLG